MPANPASISVRTATGERVDLVRNPDPAKGGKQDETNALLAQLLTALEADSPGGGSVGDASAANQLTLIGHLDGVEGSLAALIAKIIAAPATEAKQDALSDKVGGVTASPAANTVLGRLKDLLTGISLAAGTNTIGTVRLPVAAPVFDRQDVNASATALPAHALINGVAVKALAGNAEVVYIGGSGVTAATGYPLEPGEGVSVACANTNEIFVVGATGDKVALVGN